MVLTGATAQSTKLAEDTICTETETDNRDNLIQYFPALTVPCPAVGDFVTTRFDFRFPVGPEEDSVATQVSVAVSHEGDNPVAGITMRETSFGMFDSCGMNFHDDFFFVAEADETLCDGRLKDPSKLCSGVSFNGNQGSDDSVMVVIRNDGGCQGSLTFEMALRDLDQESIQVSSSCLSPMTVVCVDEPPVVDVCEATTFTTERETINSTSLDVKMPENSICTGETEFDKDGNPIHFFPSLTVPCPAVGEVTYVSYTHKLPTKAGEESIGVGKSIAVSHEGAEPGFGISLQEYSGLSCNEDFDTAFFAFVGETSNSKCDGSLNSPCQMCVGSSRYAAPGSEDTNLVGVRNEGGCVGELTFRVALTDLVEDLDVSSACISPIQLACDEGESPPSAPGGSSSDASTVLLSGALLAAALLM